MKVSTLLRDPAWQFVGTVISLLALVVALWPSLKLTSGEPTVSLCNYQQFSVFKSDPAPPEARDRLRLIFKGKEIPVTELSVTHFCLSNHTGRTIERSDFAKPVSFKAAAGVDVIYVRSYRQEPTTAVAADWRRLENNTWELAPTVLNADETLWVQAVYRVPEAMKEKTPTDIFQWQALFKGATFKVASPTSTEPAWYNLQIKHEGLGLYLLVGAGLIISFAVLSIHHRRFRAAPPGGGRVITVVLLTAFAWAAAEIAVDVLYNQRTNQPLFGWLFLALLVIVSAASLFVGPTRPPNIPDDEHDG